MSTQIPQAIDKLVALATAAIGDDEELTITDGPRVAFPTRKFVVIGGDGPVQEEEDAARAPQMWKGLGAKIRDEAIDVTCAVGVSTGDTDEGAVRRIREEAKALLVAIEDALRADPGLGNFTTGGAAAISEITLRYPTNSSGIAATFVFTINIPVRSGP